MSVWRTLALNRGFTPVGTDRKMGGANIVGVMKTDQVRRVNGNRKAANGGMEGIGWGWDGQTFSGETSAMIAGRRLAKILFLSLASPHAMEKMMHSPTKTPKT